MYKLLPRDPAPAFETSMNHAGAEESWYSSTSTVLSPAFLCWENPFTYCIYGFPKIHKPHNPCISSYHPTVHQLYIKCAPPYSEICRVFRSETPPLISAPPSSRKPPSRNRPLAPRNAPLRLETPPSVVSVH